MQSILLKYESILISEDEDTEIIFSTVSLHLYLSGTELYLKVLPIKAEQDEYEVADRDIRITQGTE